MGRLSRLYGVSEASGPGCYRFFLSFFLLALLVCSPAHSATLATGARMDDKMGYFRFVIDLSEVGDYEVFTVPNPPRVVIDLVNARWNGNKESLEKMKGRYVQKVRYGHPEMGILRVVLDAKVPLQVKKKFVIAPKGENKKYRLVIDMSPDTSAAAVEQAATTRAMEEAKPPASQFPASMKEKTSPPTPAQEAAPELPDSMKGDKPAIQETAEPELKNVPEKPVPVAKTEELPEGTGRPLSMASKPEEKKKIRGEKPVIVVDAGHGGIDPGASGKSGIKEKDVTLRYANELKQKLEASGKYKVVMTRKGDYFVNLRDRVAIAKESKGDLFISVHADSHPEPKTRGLSVYTLSEKASDREAAALAERANDEDVINGVDLRKESEDLQGLLIDMVQRDTKNHSAEFAQMLVNNLGKEARLLENSHRFAGFVVLTGADVPSILVELGYLSNRIEEKLLQTPEYRQKIIEAMSETVDSYFAKNNF